MTRRSGAPPWRSTRARAAPQSAVGGRLLILGDGRAAIRAQLREAATRQERALALCPESTDAFRAAIIYTRLGGAQALLDDRPAAQQALLRAAQLAPTYALPYVWLGYLAHLQADQETAAEMLRHAVIDLGPPDGTVAGVARLYVDSL